MDSVKVEYSNSSLCYGCLNVTRRVTHDKQKSEIYLNLLGGDNLSSETRELTFCWECTAILRRIQRFIKQIRDAQVALLLYQWDASHSMSRLETVTKDGYDFKYEHDITIEVSKIEEPSVKEESLDNFTLTAKEEIDNDYDDPSDLYDTGYIDHDHLEDLIKPDKKSIIKKPEKSEIKPLSIRNYEKYATFSQTKEKVTLSELKHYYKKVNINNERFEELLNSRDRKEMSFNRMPFKCTACSLGYKNKRDLDRHNSVHHYNSAGPFKCWECKTKFTSHEALLQHSTSHIVVYECVVCGELHRSLGEIRKHVNRSHTGCITCNECGDQSRTLREFSKHYRNAHERLLCDHCGKGFYKKRVLESHMRRHHLPANCQVCGRHYAQYHTLELHLRTCHPKLMKGAYNIEASYCVECDRQYTSVYKYRKHLSQSIKHTPKKVTRVPCPECGKIFSRTNYMKNHYKLFHSKDTKHFCQLCNKLFVNGHAARKHKQFVHDKQPLPKNKLCDICGRGFTTNRILDNHRRTHTGERPFGCAHCSAAFAQRTALATHTRSQHRALLAIS